MSVPVLAVVQTEWPEDITSAAEDLPPGHFGIIERLATLERSELVSTLAWMLGYYGPEPLHRAMDFAAFWQRPASAARPGTGQPDDDSAPEAGESL